MSHESSDANRYDLIRLLGTGATGEVHLVDDRQLGRTVARKILKPDQHHPEGILRFKREYYLLRRLRHPNVLEVFDYGTTPEGHHFFTMEALEEPLRVPDAGALRSVLVQLARALGFLHARGFVHGDVTLQNARRRADGSVALIDFGLAVPIGSAQSAPRGTPAYMAPEAVLGTRLDGRSDLYSLGVLAYQLACGRLPFEADRALGQMKAQLERVAELPSTYNPALDPEQDRLIARLIAKDPLARFASAGDLLEALGAEPEEAGTFLPLASHFVGRQAPLGDMDARLLAARGQRGSELWFSGPPGSGKSRLLEEIRLRAEQAGACVLSGSCSEGGPPYAPFLVPLRQLVARLPADRLQALRGALGGLLTELRDPADPVLDPQREAARRHGAIQEGVAEIARQMPVVVLLDDWQWADASSLALLAGLRGLLDAHALVIVGVTRAGEPAAQELAGFGPEQTREMLASMLGDPGASEHFAARLAAVTAGRPAAIEATVRELLARGALKRQDGLWQYPVAILEDLPPDAVSRLSERLEALPPLARQALEVAATIGRPFMLSRLVGTLGGPDDRALGAVETLEQQGLLIRQGDCLFFADSRWPGLLRDGLAPERSRALNAALAADLTRTGQPIETLEDLHDMARFALAGEHPEQGVSWAIRAARQAMALYAVSEASRLLTAARPHAGELEQGAIAHLLGDAERYASRALAALEHYERALASESDEVTRGRILTSSGLCAMMTSDHAGALARFELASRVLDGRDEREWLRCTSYQARTLYFTGAISQAVAMGAHALERARALGQPQPLCACLGLLGMLYTVGEGRHEEGICLLGEALGLCEALGDKIELGETYSLLGVAQLAKGDLASARTSFERNLALAEQTNTPNDVVVAQINLALVCHELGAPERTGEFALRARSGAQAIGSDLFEGIALLLAAVNHAARGELEAAQTLYSQLEARLESDPHEYLGLMGASYGSEIALAQGQLRRALALATSALEWGQAQGNPEFEGRSRILAAEASLRLGDLEEAVALVGPLREAVSDLDRGKATYLLAWCAWQVGKIEEAQALAAQAQRQLGALGAQRWEARAHILLSEVFGGRYDRVQAAGHAHRALRLAHVCEAPGLTCHALVALAATQPVDERRTTWHRVGEVLGTFRDHLGPGRYEELLALEELRRASLGEVEGEPGGAQRHLASEREAKLLAELERLRADQRRHEILLRFLAETSSEGDYLEDLRRTIASVASLLGADDGLLLLPDSAGRLDVYSVYNVDAAQIMGFSRTIAESCFRSGQTVFISDTEAWPDVSAQQSVIDLQIQSALAVPLRAGDRAIGVIYIHRKTAFNGFSLEDREMAELFARHAAKTLEQSRKLAEATALARRESMLGQLASSLSEAPSVATVLERAAHATLDFTSASRALVLLAQGEELCLRISLDRYGPLEAESVVYPAGVCQEVLDSGQAVSRLVADQDDDPLCMPLRSMLCAPLTTAAGTYGVLYVDRADVVTSWMEAELQVLGAIASLAAIALRNAARVEGIELLSAPIRT